MYRSKRKTRPTKPSMTCGCTYSEKFPSRMWALGRKNESSPSKRRKVMRHATIHSHHSLLSIRRKFTRRTLDCPSVASPERFDLCSRNHYSLALPSGTVPACLADHRSARQGAFPSQFWLHVGFHIAPSPFPLISRN